MNLAKRIPGFYQSQRTGCLWCLCSRRCSLLSQDTSESQIIEGRVAGLRGVSRAPVESSPVTPEDQHSLKAAIIGLPNVGKSTLVNQLIGQKVFAVSPKRHTTLHRAMGVLTEGTSQVVLLDTPGLIPYRDGRKLKVTKQFLTDPARSTMEADIIVVMLDAANKHNRDKLDPQIVSLLTTNSHLPSVLVLNKVDLLKHKHILLSVTEGLTGTLEAEKKHRQISDLKKKLRDVNLPDKVRTKFESIIKDLQSELSVEKSPENCEGESGQQIRTTWPYFKEIFMVSSLTGDGMDSLKNYLLSQAVQSEWQYSLCDLTDTPALNLVEDIIREKLFKYLEKEIPYVITQDNVMWEESEGALTIYQNINCKNDTQTSIVIGPAGRTIQAITAETKADVENLLNCSSLDLTLNVRTHHKR